jgi:acylphosphatase
MGRIPGPSDWEPGRIVRAHVRVEGRVQGVFFRQEALRAARREGVGGWVRNLPDGDVEAVFEGPRAGVEAMVAWARHGPPVAMVTRIDVRWEPTEGEGPFHVR